MYRAFVGLVILLFPWVIRVKLYKIFLGYDISDGAKIGLSLVAVQKLKMESGARIGSFTVIRNLEKIHMHQYASIGTFNWIFGLVEKNTIFFRDNLQRCSELIVHEHAAISSRHILDCIDKVTIGKYSTVAGFRTQFISHSIDLKTSKQSCEPIVIGDYCFVGSSCIFLKGSKLPSYSVVSAGSVFSRKDDDENYMLYSGNLAAPVKKLSSSYEYFNRTLGFVR